MAAPSSATVPPVVSTSSTCTQTGLSSTNYNGRSLTAQIPPAGELRLQRG